MLANKTVKIKLKFKTDLYVNFNSIYHEKWFIMELTLCTNLKKVCEHKELRYDRKEE